jgi:hypothetical protein
MKISSHMLYDTKSVKMFRSANISRINLYITIAQYVKLWPRFKTHRWPSHRVMAMYNNIGICPTVTNGQHHSIYCISEVGMTCKNNYLLCQWCLVTCAFRYVRATRVWLSENIIYQVQNEEISLSDEVLFLWLCVSEITLWLVFGRVYCIGKEGNPLHYYPTFTTKHLFKTELKVLLQFGIFIFSDCCLGYWNILLTIMLSTISFHLTTKNTSPFYCSLLYFTILMILNDLYKAQCLIVILNASSLYPNFSWIYHFPNSILLFLIIKPPRSTNFSNLFLEWNSTCFGQFLCPSLGDCHCTHSNGVCHTGLLKACEQSA